MVAFPALSTLESLLCQGSVSRLFSCYNKNQTDTIGGTVLLRWYIEREAKVAGAEG